MDFHVKNKIITLDKETLPPDGVVGDNTGYIAKFFFDAEWKGKEKIARFIGKTGYKEQFLKQDSCEIPIEVLKGGLLLVGVYSGDLESSTAARVPILASILNDDGPPADPTPDVYAQMMKSIEEIRDSSVSDEEIKSAVVAYLTENPVETGLTVKNWSEEDFEE